MNKLILLAGAGLMLALGTPATADAKPGHGNSAKIHGVGKPALKSSHSIRTRALVDRNRNRIDDRDEALARKYGGGLCPPGLYKKTPSCMPPGQAKRLFREGQRVNRNYRYWTPYGDIPLVLRNQYNLDDDYRYIYRNNVIYAVDPATNLITRIINAVL